MASGAQRKRIVALAVVLALPLTVYGLLALAQAQLDAHLRHAAAQALALEANGDTPYHWVFNEAADLIAGRVFGSDAIGFNNGTLEIKAPANPFELGLPLTRPIDLRRYNRLRIEFDIESPGTLTLVTRETLDAQERISQPIALRPGIKLPELVLDRLSWSSTANHQDNPSIAMLRLRWQLTAGALLRLHMAQLSRVENADRLDLDQPLQVIDPKSAAAANSLAVYSLPVSSNIEQSSIEQLNLTIAPTALPLMLLPKRGRVEEQLALRQAIYTAFPAAIIIPDDQLTITVSEARATPIPAQQDHGTVLWWGVTLYVLVLIGVRLRPPRHWRLRALLEAGLALVGFLWFIVDGRFGSHVKTPEWILLAASLVFALSLRRPADAPELRLFGTFNSWRAPLLVIGAAIGLAMAWHRPLGEIDALPPSHFIRYLIWALAQQYLICVIVAERLQAAFRHTWISTYVCAVAFALLHTPNASLMLLTFVGELIWCAIYLRERTLLPIATSHAVCATLLIATLPATVLRSAEVSARFFF